MMDPERILQMYADVSAPNRQKSDRWFNANALLGSILVAGIFAMAIAGLSAPPPNQTAGKVTATTGWNALRTIEDRRDFASRHEFTIRLAPYQFPVRHPDEPF